MFKSIHIMLLDQYQYFWLPHIRLVLWKVIAICEKGKPVPSLLVV